MRHNSHKLCNLYATYAKPQNGHDNANDMANVSGEAGRRVVLTQGKLRICICFKEDLVKKFYIWLVSIQENICFKC